LQINAYNSKSPSPAVMTFAKKSRYQDCFMAQFKNFGAIMSIKMNRE